MFVIDNHTREVITNEHYPVVKCESNLDSAGFPALPTNVDTYIA